MPNFLRRACAVPALACALATAPAMAIDVAAMSDAERAAFRAEIRSYLLENPEVLMEAIAVLERRQAAEAERTDRRLVADNADALFADGRSWVGGNPDGDVTVVEFLDYRCGYCRRAHPEVAQLIETDGEIRYIVKEFPILGEDSVLASRFAIATRTVAGADAYKQVNDRLMTLRGDVNEAALMRLARELDLDGASIAAAMNAPEVTAELRANRELATRLDISGTPSFVFGDRMMRGYVPLAQMLDLVETVRAE